MTTPLHDLEDVTRLYAACALVGLAAGGLAAALLVVIADRSRS